MAAFKKAMNLAEKGLVHSLKIREQAQSSEV